MTHHAKAPSAGSSQATGSTRGLLRRAFATRRASSGSRGSGAPSSRRRQPALIAGLALIVSLAFGASAAVAADPTVTIDPSPTASYTTAHVSGAIETDQFTYFEFEYSTDGVNWSGFNYGNHLEAGAGLQSVSADLTLQPGTHYSIRLEVRPNAGGEFFSAGPDPSIDTLPVTAPSVSLDPITTFTGSTAHLSGTVDTNAPAGPLSDAAKAAYQTKWHFECTPGCHGLSEVVIEAEDGSVTVSADVDRLEANTPYEVTLVASNAGGTTTDGPESFSTPLVDAKVESAEGASDGKGGYTLQGVVNPHNSKVTDCHFEYGPTAAYVFEAPCSPMPTGRDEVQEFIIAGEGGGQFKLSYQGQTTGDIPYEATGAEVQAALEGLSKIGANGVSVTAFYDEHTFSGWHYTITFSGPNASTNAGEIHSKLGTTPVLGGSGPTAGSVAVLIQGGNNLPVLVEAHLTGLTPNATYHFQVVATTGAGTIASGDGIFVPTLAPGEAGCPKEAIRAENASLGLPECRAYEMVTPPGKNGYNALLLDYTENESILYSSYAGNIANSGMGGVASRYTSVRTDAGWKTIPNLNGVSGSPYSGPNALFGTAGPPELYSADLRSSIWSAAKAGDSANEADIYLREPDGSFAYVGPGANRELDPANPGNNVSTDARIPSAASVGASDDLSHLVFNGITPFGPRFGPGVYEFIGTGNDGPTRRVDLDNSGDPVSTCENPFGNQNGPAFGNAVSPDASVIIFTAVGGCGAGSPAASEIWARVDGNTSYDASESHCTRTVASPGGACNAASDAVYAGSARNGSRIFFNTTQQLVNGDIDQTPDIYAYDLPSASHPSAALHEVSGAASGANPAGIVSISEDGSSVYFVSEKVLADGEDALGEPAAAGDPNLYVWQSDADHSDETTFIARLTGLNDGCILWTGPYPFCTFKAQSTSDGRYLVFPSATPLVPTDTDNARDIYRYDAETGTMIRASTNTFGIGGNVDNFDVEMEVCPPLLACKHAHPSVSNDGEGIVFTTSEALSGADGNGASDVYFWKSGHVFLISSGAVGGGGETARIDGTGKNIYFSTGQPLSPDDTDLVGDVYDARVDGGFAAGQTTSCSGEACQPKSGPPAAASPATDRPNGSGNVAPGKVAVKPVSSADRAKLASGDKVGLKLKVSGPGKVSVKGTAKIGGKQKQVFAATLTAKKAGQVKLPISLSKEAQAQLRKDGSLTIQVTTQFAGAAPQTSKLVLKTAKAKPGHAKRGDG